ncbi:hypothetical protein GALL_245340 [mine drainage metagenome]|uniref:Transcriptional regulator-like domain-containing protein n=1 Tax=mine drainage metagenome TaxID=410659 RepID=A0A1J5RZE7_9ZZZZ
MLSIDWRSPAAYVHANSIPAAGFAWEYLRRDESYHKDYARLDGEESSEAAALTIFSRRWGLRFPA